MLYQLAMGTGFRANELRTLTPEAFDLDGDPPTVTVKAAYSKRRRDDVQPIRTELADALRPWLAARAPGKPLFGKLTKHTADMLRHDLKAAGIPYETDSGTADFHALQTFLRDGAGHQQRAGQDRPIAGPASTPTLTLGVYAHVGLFDQSAALDALPDLTEPPRPPALRPAMTRPEDSFPTDNRPIRPPGPPGAGSPGRKAIHKRTPFPPFSHRRGRFSPGLSLSDVMTGSDVRKSMERGNPRKQGI